MSNSQKKLEVITCTQRKQNWGKASKQVAESILEPKLISDLTEMKCYQRYEYNETEEERTCFAEILFSGNNLITLISRKYNLLLMSH